MKKTKLVFIWDEEIGEIINIEEIDRLNPVAMKDFAQDTLCKITSVSKLQSPN